MISHRKFDAGPVPVQTGALFGAFGCAHLEDAVSRGLYAQLHRSAGAPVMAFLDSSLMRRLELPRVPDFSNPVLESGNTVCGVGALTFSEDTPLEKCEPLVVSAIDGKRFALCGTGNLIAKSSVGFISRVSELMQEKSEGGTMAQCFERAIRHLQGGFSILCMSEEGLLAARDPYGIRPLVLGELNGGYALAPSTQALDAAGATPVKNVLPGEMITVRPDGVNSHTFTSPVNGSLRQSFLELLHGGKAGSTLYGESIQCFHQRLGLQLADEVPLNPDGILPSPPRAKEAAEAYSHRMNIPLIDLHKGLKSAFQTLYLSPEELTPDERVRLRDALENKSIAVVDPSLILDEKLIAFFHALREFGLRDLHVLSASPRVLYAESGGIRLPALWEEHMKFKSEAQLMEIIGARTLAYLSLRGLLFSSEQAFDYSTACFTGVTPSQSEDSFAETTDYQSFFSAKV